MSSRTAKGMAAGGEVQACLYLLLAVLVVAGVRLGVPGVVAVLALGAFDNLLIAWLALTARECAR